MCIRDRGYSARIDADLRRRTPRRETHAARAGARGAEELIGRPLLLPSPVPVGGAFLLVADAVSREAVQMGTGSRPVIRHDPRTWARGPGHVARGVSPVVRKI